MEVADGEPVIEPLPLTVTVCVVLADKDGDRDEEIESVPVAQRLEEALLVSDWEEEALMVAN